jgi:hypothetical protein
MGFASKAGFVRPLLTFLRLKQSIFGSFLTFEAKPRRMPTMVLIGTTLKPTITP